MIKICRRCHHHFLASEGACPHCSNSTVSSTRGLPVLALLMGLGVAGCGDRDTEKDTAEVSEPDTDTASDTDSDTAEGSDMALYGVAIFDDDEDGFDQDADCDDSDPTVYPGAAELDSTTECMKDADGDGYGDNRSDAAFVAGTDCDDADPQVHPAAMEVSGDGVDQNCDGQD